MISQNPSSDAGSHFWSTDALHIHWEMERCCPVLYGVTVSDPIPATTAAALASSVRQSSDDNLGHSNLHTSNMKSQLLTIPPLDTPLAKMGTKDVLKPERPPGLDCSEQPFPIQQEKESRRGSETERTHSTIYCPKKTSSTKGTTIIIERSPLICEGDLQPSFFPSARARGSQERRACRIGAAAPGMTCRSEGCPTEKGVLSPPLPRHCAATTFQNASC